MVRPHSEIHMVARINWLRAAVLGANDGIISTGSLIVGVAAATALKQDMMISGVAGLEKERRELEGYPAGKLT